MIVYILIALFVLLMFQPFRRLWGKWRLNQYLKRTIPHPKAHWLYGHLKDGLNDPGLVWWKKATAQFPRGFVVLLGPFDHFVVLNHPDLIRPTINDLKATKKSELFQELFVDWLGINLALANGDDWWRQRKLLTPFFHFKTLKGYCKTFNQISEVFLKKLSKYAEQERPLETSKHVALCILDSVLQTAFSYKTGCQESEDCRAGNAINTLTSIAITRSFEKPLLQNRFIFQLSPLHKIMMGEIRYFHSIQDKVIKLKQEIMRPGYEAPEDFLESLLMTQEENKISVKEIKNHINTIIFGGQDTTSSAITFLLLALAKHPDCQRKVQSEIDTLLDGRDSDEIMWEDLPSLEYLTMCIKESLRVYASINPSRELVQEINLGDGLVLPIGTMISYYNLAVHHNPAVWGENHEDFQPSHFSKENVVSMDPFAFIPFSAGSRNCIGMNFALSTIKVVVGRMLRKFDLSLISESPIVSSVVSQPETEIFLKVSKRQFN